MIQQQDNILWFKFNSLLRYYIVYGGCSLCSKHYTINEYPKSGGSWIGEMIAELINVPFPRNRLPIFSSSIMHGHYYYKLSMQHPIIIWRDGRDIIVSQYYHYLFKNDKGNSIIVDETRKNLMFSDYENIQENLPKFMQYIYNQKKHPRFNWTEFVQKWYGLDDVIYTKYEDMKVKPEEELARVIYELTKNRLDEQIIKNTINHYSFTNMSGRKEGEENTQSFLRKGVAGDWVNHFNDESKKKFKELAGKELIKLGYEQNNEW